VHAAQRSAVLSAVFMSTRSAQHQDAHYAVGHEDAHTAQHQETRSAVAVMTRRLRSTRTVSTRQTPVIWFDAVRSDGLDSFRT
jgi:hypothetical protein